MNIKTELKPVHKDHYHLFINAVDLGVWERSQLRQLIEGIDNVIL
jgi:hypothetical protein